MSDERLTRLLARLDALNAQDPHPETPIRPRELTYAAQLTRWVLRLNPQASEPLRIAARGQHVQRWTIPRERYPRTRAGYLKWRETLKAFHADTVGGLMQEAGYEPAMIERVRRLILKKDLHDPDTQTLEDALCLVFLEAQFAAFRPTVTEEKLREIVKKSWQKMSAQAREEALKLPLGNEEKAWLQQTLKN